MPYLEILPYVGLTPTIPQKLAGLRTESPVSEPIAIGTTPLATKAADPPEDPPVIRLVSHGLYAGPVKHVKFVPPIASSSMDAFAMHTAPAFLSFVTISASYTGT